MPADDTYVGRNAISSFYVNNVTDHQLVGAHFATFTVTCDERELEMYVFRKYKKYIFNKI
jgi:hypothetical protein